MNDGTKTQHLRALSNAGQGQTLEVGPGSPTIVLFGDSFTFGVGVEDVETFASRIAMGFPQYRLINLGVPGSALVQQLEILKAAPHARRLVSHVELG
jgi:hypothetical protein